MKRVGVALCLIASVPALSDDSLNAYAPRLERNLKENIVPFWSGCFQDWRGKAIGRVRR
jgi:hypothetical protein